MDDAKSALEKEGMRVKEPDSVAWTFLKIMHGIKGCEKMPHWVISNEKMVEVGRICPVCWKEYPLE